MPNIQIWLEKGSDIPAGGAGGWDGGPAGYIKLERSDQWPLQWTAPKEASLSSRRYRGPSRRPAGVAARPGRASVGKGRGQGPTHSLARPQVCAPGSQSHRRLKEGTRDNLSLETSPNVSPVGCSARRLLRAWVHERFCFSPSTGNSQAPEPRDSKGHHYSQLATGGGSPAVSLEYRGYQISHSSQLFSRPLPPPAAQRAGPAGLAQGRPPRCAEGENWPWLCSRWPEAKVQRCPGHRAPGSRGREALGGVPTTLCRPPRRGAALSPGVQLAAARLGAPLAHGSAGRPPLTACRSSPRPSCPCRNQTPCATKTRPPRSCATTAPAW